MRLIEAAMRGETIAYSALGTGRSMVGSYLYRIAKEEQAAGQPPLTALVVHKTDGKPGPGFLEATKWVGFWREGETEDQVWRRAVHRPLGPAGSRSRTARSGWAAAAWPHR